MTIKLQLITQGLLTRPLTEHSILQFSLSSANISQYLISEKKKLLIKYHLNTKENGSFSQKQKR